MSDAPTDPRIAALLDTLRRSFDGDAWHGPALADVLRAVDARAAVARPVPGAHSIWELTRHLGAWADEIARRLRGGVPTLPAAGDWPPAPDADRATAPAWTDACASLRTARDGVLAALAAFAPDRLDAALPPSADVSVAADALGARHSYAGMVLGLAEHNAYHGGQIALLRRALGAPVPPNGPA